MPLYIFVFIPRVLCYIYYMVKSCHEILGVRENATIKDIRKAFKKLAKKYHPDLNAHDPLANERFKEIVNAYESLCNHQACPDHFPVFEEPPVYDDEWRRLDLCMMLMEMAAGKIPQG